MRIISGEYGGRRLKALNSDQTRPTTDKVKEAIFNMIGPFFEGGVVLDLYSGSGGLAIEAISRGMTQAICIEKNYAALKIIQENIAVTKEPAKFTVKKMPANKALATLAAAEQKVDLVFLDPPYALQEIEKQLAIMLETDLLTDDAVIVCETDRSVELPETVADLTKSREALYGITKITIYQRGA